MGVLFEYLIWSQARFGCPKNVNDSVSTEFNGKRSPSNNLWNKDRLFGHCRNTHTCVGNCIYSVVLNSRAQIKCFQRFDLFDFSLFGSGAETSRGVGWVVCGRGLLLPTWTCRNGIWGWPGNLWRAAIFVSLFNLFFCPTLSFCVFQLATKTCRLFWHETCLKRRWWFAVIFRTFRTPKQPISIGVYSEGGPTPPPNWPPCLTIA